MAGIPVEGKEKSSKPKSAGRQSASRALYRLRSACQGCNLLFASPKGKKRHLQGNKESETDKHVLKDKLGAIRVLGKPETKRGSSLFDTPLVAPKSKK